MQKITKDTVLIAHGQSPRRKCFSDEHPALREEKGYPTFDVKFESVKKVFEDQTEIELFKSQEYGNYWRRLENDGEIKTVREWISAQGNRVYLRDCLPLSMALEVNLIDNTSGQYTEIGKLENDAKNQTNEDAINKLAHHVSYLIQDIPDYKNADFICSVPSPANKVFDLPRKVTRLVSQIVGKQDISNGFIFAGEKNKSVKEAKFEEKWNIWEAAHVSFSNASGINVSNKKVILIDDKYQSGTTIQYIAMKLQQAGVRAVYGLIMVKTLRDTDNERNE